MLKRKREGGELKGGRKRGDVYVGGRLQNEIVVVGIGLLG